MYGKKSLTKHPLTTSEGSSSSVPSYNIKLSGAYKGAIVELDFIHTLSLLFIEKATFTWVWLKRFAGEQQFYGNVCVGKVWLKCIQQSFKTDLIERNACQHLEPWTGVAQSHRCYKHFRRLLLVRNWLHFESNHSAEQDYSAVVLPASGTLCQKWLYFCKPKSTASDKGKDVPQKMVRNTEGLSSHRWHNVQPRMDLLLDASLSLVPRIAAGSIYPIPTPM